MARWRDELRQQRRARETAVPDDAPWRRDLRTLVDRRGARLWVLAERATDDGDDPDTVETLLVDALVRVLVPYRPARPDDGAVRGSQTVIVVDDDGALDDLETAVADVLASRARRRAGPAGRTASTGTDADEPDPSADTPDGSGAPPPTPSEVVAAVEPRVAAGRRRRAGRRRVLGLTATGAGAALVAGLVWGAGYGPGHGSPVPTTTVAEDAAAPAVMPVYPRGTTLVCGEHVDVRTRPTGAVVVGLRATAARMGPNGTWIGTVSFDADDVVASHVAFVGMPQIVVVGAHDDRVAAVGQGDLTPARAGSGTGRVLVDAVVRFPACDTTRPLGPGSYRVVAVQHYQDRLDWPYGTVYAAVSAPVTLTVARDRPTAPELDG